MKTFAPLLMTLASLAGMTHAQAADDWNDADKVKHFTVSAVLGTAAAMHFENKWTAFGVAMIPGVLKELADSRFSGKDLAADALGAALGVQLGHWIVTRNGVGYRAAF